MKRLGDEDIIFNNPVGQDTNIITINGTIDSGTNLSNGINCNVISAANSKVIDVYSASFGNAETVDNQNHIGMQNDVISFDTIPANRSANGGMVLEANLGNDTNVVHFKTAEHNKKVTKGMTLEQKFNEFYNSLSEEYPLHWAAKNGDLDSLISLLKTKKDVNTKDLQDLTPLHLAAMYGQNNVVSVLLEYGADINAKSEINCNFTPLHLAAYQGHADVIQILIDNGVDTQEQEAYVDVQSGYSNITPLRLAIIANKFDAVGVFYNNDIKIDVIVN